MTQAGFRATIPAMEATRDADKAQPAVAEPGVPALPAAAVFLDIDGTLVRHADNPGAVLIDDGLRALLGALNDAACGALALISGRAIADVDALFFPTRFAVAGQHGAERRSIDGTLHYHAPLASRLLAPALELRRLVQAHPGLLLEEKGASLALHYRGAPALAGLVEGEVRRVVAALGDEFELQAGKFVFEVKPSGKDKGTAIAEFMAEAPFAGRLPVFLGDDLTDEFGFDLVNRLGGHSVKVGPGPTRARWRLDNADAVRGWLAAYAARGDATLSRKGAT